MVTARDEIQLRRVDNDEIAGFVIVRLDFRGKTIDQAINRMLVEQSRYRGKYLREFAELAIQSFKGKYPEIFLTIGEMDNLVMAYEMAIDEQRFDRSLASFVSSEGYQRLTEDDFPKQAET